MHDNLHFPTDPGFYYTVFFALAGALIVSFAVTPLVRMLARKVGAVDDPNRDDRRVHVVPIPRLGGLAIFFGFMVSFLVFGIGELNKTVAGILVGAVVLVVVGAIDDVVPLRWWVKLAGQLVAASIPVMCGLRAEIFTNPGIFSDGAFINIGVLGIPVTILWIIGITNALNLIDGLDGLAVGVSGIASISMLLISLSTGNPAAAILTAALTGGCLGFLPYNFNPARLFMGDSGALFLGYILSCASILGLFKFYALLSVVPFIILGLPILDTTLVFFRRLAKGKNPFSTPDRKHVHHRLIDMGFSQKQAVAILYSVSAVLGLSAVVLTTSGELRVVILLLAVLAAIAVYIGIVKKNSRKNGDDKE
jgi:UDP-GlcNAc:undecaprenyl-phosphate GlcNAc-1-phosphate transferase